ncbi:MAG: MIP/aquaporin family protein [Opitutales bacterium]
MSTPMPYIAEFIGTLILVLLGDGVVANVLLKKTKGESSGWIVITTGWGLAVAMAVYAVGRYSGGHINPAVTIGLASIGAFPWAEVPAYIISQMLGAIVGAVLVYLAYFSHWEPTSDGDAKRGVFCTAPNVRQPAANFICELIGTAMLVFGVLAITANAQHIQTPDNLDISMVFSTGIAPLIVGFLVFSIGLSLGGPTGYAINPARDLGPRIAHAILPIPGKAHSDWGYSWIPVLGPIAGGAGGAWLFVLLGM